MKAVPTACGVIQPGSGAAIKFWMSMLGISQVSVWAENGCMFLPSTEVMVWSTLDIFHILYIFINFHSSWQTVACNEAQWPSHERFFCYFFQPSCFENACVAWGCWGPASRQLDSTFVHPRLSTGKLSTKFSIRIWARHGIHDSENKRCVKAARCHPNVWRCDFVSVYMWGQVCSQTLFERPFAWNVMPFHASRYFWFWLPQELFPSRFFRVPSSHGQNCWCMSHSAVHSLHAHSVSPILWWIFEHVPMLSNFVPGHLIVVLQLLQRVKWKKHLKVCVI